MSGDKVHLLDLRLRTSAAGNQYMSGWLGKAAVVGFLDREQEGEVWNIFVSTPTKPGEGQAAAKRRRQSNGHLSMQPGDLDDRLDDL